MKKRQKKKLLKILRWIILLPSICIVWLGVALVCAYVAGRFYTPELWSSWGLVLMRVGFFVLPSVSVFFTARRIAPKYKNIVGWITVILCALWILLLYSGLAHLAY